MQSERLKIDLRIVAALFAFSAMFSGTLSMIIIGGYVLLFESNEWIRKFIASITKTYVTFYVIWYLVDMFHDALISINDYNIMTKLHLYSLISYTSKFFGVVKFAILAFLDLILLMKAIKAYRSAGGTVDLDSTINAGKQAFKDVTDFGKDLGKEMAQNSQYVADARQSFNSATQSFQGQRMQGQPMNGQMMQGQYMGGQPMQGQPVQGQPVQGQSMGGQMMQGQPVSEQYQQPIQEDRNFDNSQFSEEWQSSEQNNGDMNLF